MNEIRRQCQEEDIAVTSERSSFSDDFGPFENRVWLNCAHQGPLPRIAVEAAYRAVQDKITPHLITDASFCEVPHHLRFLLGSLIHVPAEEIILGNSATYGLHLLANGIQWESSDEILLCEGDFPTNIFPWLPLRKRGVNVRCITPSHTSLQASDVASNSSQSTRLVCVSWVNSFTGHVVDIDEIGDFCRKRGIVLVVNVTQALGTRCLDLRDSPLDAIVCCGFKWLCGPYGTGFCWVKPNLLDSLNYDQAYWSAMQGDRSISEGHSLDLRTDIGARAYDVFCTANFLNFLPWSASLEYLLDIGIGTIANHNSALINRMQELIDFGMYDMISPEGPDDLSTILTISNRHSDVNRDCVEHLRECGVDAAIRNSNIRFSPHLYNSMSEVEETASLLNTFTA